MNKFFVCGVILAMTMNNNASQIPKGSIEDKFHSVTLVYQDNDRATLVYQDLVNNKHYTIVAERAHHTEGLARLVVCQELVGNRVQQTVTLLADEVNAKVLVDGVDADPCPRFKNIGIQAPPFMPAYTGKAVVPGARYEHYSGKRYTVLDVAYDAATNEHCVVYRAEYTDSTFGAQAIWVRPLAMFIENTTINGNVVPRFKRV